METKREQINTMLSPDRFHQYQKTGIQFCLKNPRAMMWLFMSAGKTVVSLTAIAERYRRMELSGALVIAPRLVAETVWPQEVHKWSHLKNLKVAAIRGKESTRLYTLCRRDIHVHVINYELLGWLTRKINELYLARGNLPPWNMLILDEVDRFKNAQGIRFQEFENLLVPPGHKQKNIFAPDPDRATYFPYRIGQTGTPASNGLYDLHGQYRAIDGGKRLYFFVGDFRKMFCSQDGLAEYNSFKVTKESAKQEILRRVSDITLSLNEKDHIKLPDYMYHDHWIKLPSKIQTAYDTLEKEMFAQLDRHVEDPVDGDWTLLVESAPSARMKCRQLANGFVYNAGKSTLIHDLKLEILDQVIHEANGKPVLISYMFRSDMKRIVARYSNKGYTIAYIGPGVKNAASIIADWNQRKIDILISNPGSIGHGMNLQNGGNEIVWFGLTDNPRWWLQFNARLRRQGQEAESVHVRSLLAENTVDEVIRKTLEMKEFEEQEARAILESYRRKKGL